MNTTVNDLLIYEHIKGFPDYLDSINEELTYCLMNDCQTLKEAKSYIKMINKDLKDNNKYYYLYPEI